MPDVFDAWIAAINSRQLVDVKKALHPDVQIEVYGVDDRRDVQVKAVQGHAGALEWILLAPPATVFERAPSLNEDPLQARYRVKVLYFEGAGSWRGKLAEDGRLRWFEHRPDDLDDVWRAPPLEVAPDPAE